MMLKTTVLLIFASSGLVRAQSGSPGPKLMKPADLLTLTVSEPDHKFAYGTDPNQYGELRLPPSPGPHFETASPASAAWPIVRDMIRSLLDRRR